MTDLFEGVGLTCERGGREVFRDLSFKLPRGRLLLVQGPNGSGKSSLLRLCAGLIPPAGGRLLRGGEPVSDDPDSHRAGLHYVGHLAALKPPLTLRRNLEHWAALYGVTAPRGVVVAALDRLRLAALADLPARILSAGQQRRAALARLLIRPAPLWLLDEPTVGLDARSAADLARLMAEHLAAGGQIMAATHQDLGIADHDLLDLGALVGGPRP